MSVQQERGAKCRHTAAAVINNCFIAERERNEWPNER